MGLQQTLDKMKQDFVAGADPEALAIMGKATADLLQSDILDHTLKAGDRAPDFTLNDSDGQSFNSQKLHEKGSLLITFYRGIW